ncbi:hypothetical protein F5Y17DRAFT_460651 [Xylariaceae sp. FL0594]|nr:hypothetical protein F5Y17DRAFT_460651 [Xylariaceae sp. FL0594]
MTPRKPSVQSEKGIAVLNHRQVTDRKLLNVSSCINEAVILDNWISPVDTISVVVFNNENCALEFGHIASIANLTAFNNTNCTFNFDWIVSVADLAFTRNSGTIIPRFPRLQTASAVYLQGYINESLGPDVFPVLGHVSRSFVVDASNKGLNCSQLASQLNGNIVHSLRITHEGGDGTTTTTLTPTTPPSLVLWAAPTSPFVAKVAPPTMTIAATPDLPTMDPKVTGSLKRRRELLLSSMGRVELVPRLNLRLDSRSHRQASTPLKPKTEPPIDTTSLSTSNSPTAASGSTTGLSRGAQAGIGLAASLVGLGIIGTLIWVFIQIRRRLESLEAAQKKAPLWPVESSSGGSIAHVCGTHELDPATMKDGVREKPDDHVPRSRIFKTELPDNPLVELPVRKD